MSTILRIKGAAALLLVGSLALPQSTCSGYRGPDGKFVPELPRDSTRSAYQPAVERHYALDDVRLDDPGTWFNIALFFWPLAAVASMARARSGRLRTFLAVVEPILAVCSAYVIWSIATLFATPAAGAYVAIGALAVYFAACAVEVWRAVRSRRVAVEDAAVQRTPWPK